ncbi:hypothetical protein [Roseisolibacter sp. H3M3-2]|uniref:hypothetical protein n=1 Tax=Roseisolibacter sp. H3M3-2 TaxID=3031323 RepID=UPI0023DC022D|nr:hypothetical protein [Roseisolibacter sp. H3M3-2]MDF1502285.1 hypothetical protein [Roseisolibacter sp. H3M3-2]
MLRPSYVLVITAGTLATGACNPFRSPMKRAPVVQVSTRDANVNARWHGTLASPSNLAGAVQMKGSVAMTPGSNRGNTYVSVDLSNASPGGLHPWQLRRGQCGMDDGVIGAPDAYKALKVDEQGRANGSVTVPIVMPSEGRYYVSVGASAANPETIVACGNLASPTR